MTNLQQSCVRPFRWRFRHALAHETGLAALLLAIAACRESSSAHVPKPVAIASPQPAAPTANAPALRLVIAGELEGVLEPCGCTSRPAGGIDRVAAAVATLRDSDAPVRLITTGNLWYAPLPAEERQQDAFRLDTLEALLGTLRPDVVAPGPIDLARAGRRLQRWLRAPHPPAFLGDPAAFEGCARSTLLRVPGLTVGLTALHVGGAADLARDLAALDREVAALRNRGANSVLALVHGEDREAIAALAIRTAADAVVYSGTAPTDLQVPLPGDSRGVLLDSAQNGEHLLVLELRPAVRGRALTARYLALGADAPRDPVVRAVLDQLFRRINTFNIAHEAPRKEIQRNGPIYVGAQSCAACHTRAYAWWRDSPHGRAYQTLVQRGRQLDLDCVGCHVTGFDRPGGATLADLERLQAVGCEACHGAGGDHADNPRAKRQTISRAVATSVCLRCHDRDHSTAFDANTARSAILVAAHGLAR